MSWGFLYNEIYSGSFDWFRVKNIKGRGFLSEIESRLMETSAMHGAHYYGFRYKPRLITLEISVYANSLEAFRAKFRELANWLNPKNGPKPMIFDDEKDKQYFAVFTGLPDPDETYTKRTFELKFLCPDPFLYALQSRTKAISGGSVLADNDGNEETFPVYNINVNGVTEPDNFAGKLAGSTVENPHSGYYTWSQTQLVLPDAGTGKFEMSGTSSYDKLFTLDGTTSSVTRTLYQVIPQHLFSFNLIALIERKYGITVPGASTTEQVDWLKSNITKITANWWGKGTNKQADNVGTANFAGKVKGSNSENPHYAGRRAATALESPNGAWAELDNGDTDLGYLRLYSLEGNTSKQVYGVSGYISQHRFSFNLIEYIKRKYSVTVPGATVADQVQWLKDNVTRLSFNWHGYGSGPSGNKAYLTFAEGSSWYSPTVNSHSIGAVDVLNWGINSPSINNRIQTDGFIHFLAYTEASDGSTASAIYTDYVELEVTLKPGADKANVSWWNTSASAWSSPVTQTGETVSQVGRTTAVPSVIDSSGFAHFLAYAEPSNGISPSVIETDYVELIVELGAVPGLYITDGEKEIKVKRQLSINDNIVVDADRGKITLNGSMSLMPTMDIDSDFFPLQPGDNTIMISGGSGNVSYVERWNA